MYESPGDGNKPDVYPLYSPVITVGSVEADKHSVNRNMGYANILVRLVEV